MAGVTGNQSAIDRVEELRAKRNRSATFIQARVRGLLARKFAARFRIQSISAAAIQSQMRGNVVRIRRGFGRFKARPVGERVKRRHAAGTVIAALVRGGLVRLSM